MSPRRLSHWTRRRLDVADEAGFTLIELTIVLLILGILMTIALPSYLAFKDRANKTAAKANVSQLYKAAAAYRVDNFPKSQTDPDPGTSTADTGYQGITLGALATKYDASISTVVGAPFVIDPANFVITDDTSQICMTAVSGRWTAAVGTNGQITVGTNFTPGSCQAS